MSRQIAPRHVPRDGGYKSAMHTPALRIEIRRDEFAPKMPSAAAENKPHNSHRRHFGISACSQLQHLCTATPGSPPAFEISQSRGDSGIDDTTTSTATIDARSCFFFSRPPQPPPNHHHLYYYLLQLYLVANRRHRRLLNSSLLNPRDQRSTLLAPLLLLLLLLLRYC